MRVRALAAALLLAALAGCSTPTPAPAPAPAPVAAEPAATRPAAAPIAALAPSDPVGLEVPTIGVRSGPLMRLGIDRAGALEVPPDATTVGWFTLGPTPGAPGPAVLAAHVDYRGVPGAFTNLKAMSEGDRIRVPRADGSTAVFTAYRVARYDKSAFPTEDVYGDTAGSELRLITCGGEFDAATRNYRDNVVVYARLTGSE
ncbi:class F sortase [Pseudonocardia sp. WMMC193]|uniref:class F sortase n=1 Tax=Pseudonocardia sp. WMMC193 TaxID=2911965 RepID=UPI001F3CA055|nr:class F sortase [Pseudonocardia sp. WMMC193]MCF7551490.1 class F sortase [Pseudonocardia sp. WMMC193]